MKRTLSLLVLLVPLLSFSGNNDIYLTQTGTGLTLTIDKIGATNTIGTSQTRAEINGASMTVDLDQIGDSNTIAASILHAANSSWTYKVTGDSNTATFAVGGTGDIAYQWYEVGYGPIASGSTITGTATTTLTLNQLNFNDSGRKFYL